MPKKNIFNIFSNIDHRDSEGRTQLYKAAKDGNLKKIKQCLSSGADPNIPNYRGLTPLHQAAYWGEVEIVKELLKAGAKPDADNGKGWTPMHSAALASGLSRRPSVIKLLIEEGADSKAEDCFGWSPEDYMKLWLKHDPKNLNKIHKLLKDTPFLDNTQQPDIDKLGLEKDHDATPPRHLQEKSVKSDEADMKRVHDLLDQIEQRKAPADTPANTNDSPAPKPTVKPKTPKL